MASSSGFGLAGAGRSLSGSRGMPMIEKDAMAKLYTGNMQEGVILENFIPSRGLGKPTVYAVKQ